MGQDSYGAAGCALLGTTFAWAAATKLSRSGGRQLRTTVAAFVGQTDPHRITLIAAAVVAAESATAVTCFGWTHRALGPALFLSLMSVYVALTATGVARNIQVPCACFGRASRSRS